MLGPFNALMSKMPFFIGDITKALYISLPLGYSAPSSSLPVVGKLKCALYGLKQSLRVWFRRFTSSMKTFGYSQCNDDHTLFYRHSSSEGVALLLVFVDDIIITVNDSTAITELATHIATEFDIKHLGLFRYFVGIEVAYSFADMLLCQRKYTIELLQTFGKEDSFPLPTPIEANHRLSFAATDDPVDSRIYQRVVGKLLYLVHTVQILPIQWVFSVNS